MNLLLRIFLYKYETLAGSTRHCPGHYIKIIKCIVRAKVAMKVSPKVLHILFNKLCLKTDLPYNFCFLKFSPSCTVEAVDALQALFRAP